MTTSLLINPSIVAEAAALLGTKFQNILSYFWEDTAGYLTEIREGIAAQDVTQIILPAHSLKSSAKQLGADALSHLAREIERIAKDGAADQSMFDALRAGSEALDACFEATKAAYADHSLHAVK